jgi:hypothetical protein
MSILDSINDTKDRLDEAIADLWETRRREILKSLAIAAGLAVIGYGAYWWVEVRFRPPPSIFDTPVDDVLGYLAMDDFSQLPLEERIRFMMEFADRFRGMGQAESATMAAFMAGLTGPAREQATQNARTLAKDILAQGADEYFRIPAAERDKYIDDWIVKWTKTGERIATGKESGKPDDERLADIRKQGERGRERAASRDTSTMPSLTDDGAMRFLDFWSSDVEKASSPKEQGQIVRFLGDVRKRFER